MSDYLRRLPIYLLLDCSESMAGDAIRDMEMGVRSMIDHLQSDPHSIETAWVSAITFSDRARLLVPLTELIGFRPPKLSVQTGTALGAGLRLLSKCLRNNVRRTSATSKGDYKPLVVLFTDGQPTDDWETAADEIKSGGPAIANTYAIGCGDDVDTDNLRRVTDIVLWQKDMSPQAWSKVFVWLSASIQSTSVALAGGMEGRAVDLPALPADVLTVAPRSTGYRDPRPRQLFLHARCCRSGRLYLMRFARRPTGDLYTALGAHTLDEPDATSDAPPPPAVNTAQLDGCPACPYCENPVAALCGCGTLMCSTGRPDEVSTCPSCKSHGSLSDTPGGFDVRRARG